MSATLVRTDDEQDLQLRLDELIPPQPSYARRFLWGAAIVALALVAAVLIASGRIYPRPMFGGESSSQYPLEANQSEQWVTAKAIMPNYSERSVRITELTLDAPGASLVGSGVIVEPAYETTVVGGFDEGAEEEMEPADLSEPRLVRALPVTVAPGETAVLVLRFRPDDCAYAVDPAGTWGVASATVDFGDGAFPPFSNTVRLDQDPIVDYNEMLTFLRPNREIINILPDGTNVDVGVLTGACQALR